MLRTSVLQTKKMLSNSWLKVQTKCSWQWWCTIKVSLSSTTKEQWQPPSEDDPRSQHLQSIVVRVCSQLGRKLFEISTQRPLPAWGRPSSACSSPPGDPDSPTAGEGSGPDSLSRPHKDDSMLMGSRARTHKKNIFFPPVSNPKRFVWFILLYTNSYGHEKHCFVPHNHQHDVKTTKIKKTMQKIMSHFALTPLFYRKVPLHFSMKLTPSLRICVIGSKGWLSFFL